MNSVSIVTSVNQRIVKSRHQHVISSVKEKLPEFDFYIYNENSFLKEDLKIDGAPFDYEEYFFHDKGHRGG